LSEGCLVDTERGLSVLVRRDSGDDEDDGMRESRELSKWTGGQEGMSAGWDRADWKNGLRQHPNWQHPLLLQDFGCSQTQFGIQTHSFISSPRTRKVHTKLI